MTLCSVVPKQLRQYALTKRAVEHPAAAQYISPLKRQASGSLADTGGFKRSRSNFTEADDDSIEIISESHAVPAQDEGADEDIVITGFKSPNKLPNKLPSTKPSSRVPKIAPRPQLGAKDLQIFRISPKALG